MVLCVYSCDRDTRPRLCSEVPTGRYKTAGWFLLLSGYFKNKLSVCLLGVSPLPQVEVKFTWLCLWGLWRGSSNVWGVSRCLVHTEYVCYMQVYVRMHVRTYLFSYVCTHTHIIHTYMHACIRTYIHTCVYACMYVCAIYMSLERAIDVLSTLFNWLE